jgi:hypothetical protein
MLPAFYQKVLRAHLNESQYLTVQLLILLLQSHRQVRLSQLASVFPQPIQYASRVRNLQRFLQLPKLSVKLLWFPIIKAWLKQEYRGAKLNRAQRRARPRLRHKSSNYLLVIIDRTQWRDRNLIMVSVAWGHHALPLNWVLVPQLGSSDLRQQKLVLAPVLRMLKPYPVVVVGDREFHSAKLAIWLSAKGAEVVLRQKKSAYLRVSEAKCQALKTLGFKPAMCQFFEQIYLNKQESLGPFNLAVYWKRSYRGKGGKEPWYLLTTLSDCQQVLAIYRARWGIEMMFRDCKSGGFNLEATRVNQSRLLALILLIAMAYTLATCHGTQLRQMGLHTYLARLEKHPKRAPRQSVFWVGLSSYAWCLAMEIWAEFMQALVSLKPHKRLHFQRGLQALSLIQSTL